MNFIVQRALDYAGKRLSEASTYAGIVAFAAGVVGWHATPEEQAVIANVAFTVVGAILFFVKERKGANPLNQ